MRRGSSEKTKKKVNTRGEKDCISSLMHSPDDGKEKPIDRVMQCTCASRLLFKGNSLCEYCALNITARIILLFLYSKERKCRVSLNFNHQGISKFTVAGDDRIQPDSVTQESVSLNGPTPNTFFACTLKQYLNDNRAQSIALIKVLAFNVPLHLFVVTG